MHNDGDGLSRNELQRMPQEWLSCDYQPSTAVFLGNVPAAILHFHLQKVYDFNRDKLIEFNAAEANYHLGMNPKEYALAVKTLVKGGFISDHNGYLKLLEGFYWGRR